MYRISEQQIDFILEDLRARGIVLEDLQYNLLDHICCIIEQDLGEDGDFEACYQTVIRRFYKQELREIETETRLLLTFKNYYQMKKSLFVAGAVSAVTAFAGSFLKIMHWPGASALLLLSIVTLSFVFLPLMFILLVKNVRTSRDKLVIAAGSLTGILFFMGALFMVMHWPGAKMLWLGSLAASGLLFLPLYFFTGIRNPETRVNTIISSVLLMAFTNALFVMTTLRPLPAEKSAAVQEQVDKEVTARVCVS